MSQTLRPAKIQSIFGRKREERKRSLKHSISNPEVERISDLRYEESEEENVYHGYDTEKNDYPLEQLSKDIERTQQSEEFRSLISKLKEEAKQKCPEKLKKS